VLSLIVLLVQSRIKRLEELQEEEERMKRTQFTRFTKVQMLTPEERVRPLCCGNQNQPESTCFTGTKVLAKTNVPQN
jgi:hypothetical protein